MGLESASFISDLNTSWPLAGDLKSQGDDHLRLIKTVLQANFPGNDVAFYTSADRTDVASAASTAIGGVASQYVNITGTTTITSFGTVNAGVWRLVRFNAALTLTYNATSLILPSAASITTVAGDHCLAFSRGSGNWTVLGYWRASGTALINANGSTSAAGILELGTQSELEAATDSARVSSIGNMKYHPGVAKAWASVDTGGDIVDGWGLSSDSGDPSSGTTFTMDVTMANDDYAVLVTVNEDGTSAGGFGGTVTKTTTTFTVQTRDRDGNATAKPFAIAVFGDAA